MHPPPSSHPRPLGAIGEHGAADTAQGQVEFFPGDVHVSGTLSKAAGTFKIDHPLDPRNKYLSHSFVESPDMMNVYNGNVATDANGEASVELPAYFAALNRDFRYQLTTIGGHAPVYIAEEIKDNRFKIGGGTPGLKVSWQVTGVRQDAYATAHPIVVEEDKAAERGRFLNPEELGRSRGLAIQPIPNAAPDPTRQPPEPDLPENRFDTGSGAPGRPR